jgi:hypothetical protein
MKAAHLPLPSFPRPYLPQPAHWVANRMREKGIGFKQFANAFLKCAAPNRLQELTNSLTPWNLVTCGQKVAGASHALLHCQRARTCGLPAPVVDNGTFERLGRYNALL